MLSFIPPGVRWQLPWVADGAQILLLSNMAGDQGGMHAYGTGSPSVGLGHTAQIH